MKKKIILKRVFHRDKWRILLAFKYDESLIRLIRKITGSRYSGTHKCWYADDNEETLRQIIHVIGKEADVDISEIVSSPSVKEVKQVSGASERDDPSDISEIVSSPPVKEEKLAVKVAAKCIPDKEEGTQFGPVLFTINEPDGRLVIKFTGRYEKDWIRELNGFGSPYYDGKRKEWLLRWSQLAVDSLSDYFTGRGVEVIVKKVEVPVMLKELREDMGSEIRGRELSGEAKVSIELLRKHLEEKRYSVRTSEAYLAHLELFLKYFSDRDPAEISAKDISCFIDDYVLKLGYSASYQNIIISAIKMYYSISSRRKVKLDSFERPRKSRALPKVFSKEEVMKIFNATRNSKHRLILWLIYSCGLRRSEVINIRLTDLDTERGILNIRHGKGNVDRMVPIPQKVWEKIRAYIKTYEPVTYLFEGQTGGKYSVESVYSVFKQAMKRAGIQKEVGVHCLRHSYATHLHENGLDIRYIQELLGHKSTRTTEIYTHVSRRNLFAIRSPIEDMDLD